MLYWPRCRVLHEENEWHFRIQYASIFSFHDPKLSQKRCFMLYVYSTELFKACSMKEAIDSFFRSAISINSWKYKKFRISVSYC